MPEGWAAEWETTKKQESGDRSQNSGVSRKTKNPCPVGRGFFCVFLPSFIS